MGILSIILVGIVAGSLAKYIMPGKEPDGFVLTTLLGIGGAFIGSFLFGLVGITMGGMIGGLVSATLGAVGILWAYNKFNS